jgi:hypothetical protein
MKSADVCDGPGDRMECHVNDSKWLSCYKTARIA